MNPVSVEGMKKQSGKADYVPAGHIAGEKLGTPLSTSSLFQCTVRAIHNGVQKISVLLMNTFCCRSVAESV
jgi:hypothetical protein